MNMTVPENANKQMNELKNIIENCISMELRVKNSEVDTTLKTMNEYGFKSKISWASMELSDHTVIDFWKKDLIKSSDPKE
jgi:hypothetical protein